jgi:hypothetical protein
MVHDEGNVGSKHRAKRLDRGVALLRRRCKGGQQLLADPDHGCQPDRILGREVLAKTAPWLTPTAAAMSEVVTSAGLTSRASISAAATISGWRSSVGSRARMVCLLSGK